MQFILIEVTQKLRGTSVRAFCTASAAKATTGTELAALGITRHILQEFRQVGTRLTGRSPSSPNKTISADNRPGHVEGSFERTFR